MSITRASSWVWDGNRTNRPTTASATAAQHFLTEFVQTLVGLRIELSSVVAGGVSKATLLRFASRFRPLRVTSLYSLTIARSNRERKAMRSTNELDNGGLALAFGFPKRKEAQKYHGLGLGRRLLVERPASGAKPKKHERLDGAIRFYPWYYVGSTKRSGA